MSFAFFPTLSPDPTFSFTSSYPRASPVTNPSIPLTSAGSVRAGPSHVPSHARIIQRPHRTEHSKSSASLRDDRVARDARAGSSSEHTRSRKPMAWDPADVKANNRRERERRRLEIRKALVGMEDDVSDQEDYVYRSDIAVKHFGHSTLLPMGRRQTQQELETASSPSPSDGHDQEFAQADGEGGEMGTPPPQDQGGEDMGVDGDERDLDADMEDRDADTSVEADY